MNIIIERTIELNAPLLTEPLPGSLFTTEAKAHQFLIGCTQSGLPITLSGTVSAKFIREANNTTVLMSGSISGGKASLILPADCYNISGRFDLTIFVTANNVTTCIYSATGSVKAAQDGTLVDEGTVVPSIEQLQQDITNLQNNKVNRSGDTMTGWLRWFASSPVTGLEWASADGTLFQLRPYTSGNIMQFVVVPQGTGIATGAITIQNDGTIGFSKPVPITSGGTGETTQAGAMGVMGLLCDSGNKTTFAFDNLSLLTNTGKFKYGILFGGEIGAPFIYHVFVSVDNSVTFTQVLGGSNVATFTGTVSGSTLTLTGDRTVYGGVRLLWLNY